MQIDTNEVLTTIGAVLIAGLVFGRLRKPKPQYDYHQLMGVSNGHNK